VQIDSLTYLSRAIEAAIEAAAVPALVLVGIALVVVAAKDIGAHVRRRGRRAAGMSRTARRTQVRRTRGAET
jgi:hypothetical protein